MKPVPMSAGTTRKVPPQGYLMSTPPAVKPRRLYSASSTPGSAQKTPQRLSVGGHAHLRLPPPAPPGACACWHGKQAPPSASMRVAWQPPSPYLEDLTKTLVIAPPIRRKLQLVQTVRLKAGAPSPYEPPRETSSRARNYLRAQLQAELDERHNRILWEREAAIAASELGMDVHTYHSLLSMQHRDITPEDYEVHRAAGASGDRGGVGLASAGSRTLGIRDPPLTVPRHPSLPTSASTPSPRPGHVATSLVVASLSRRALLTSRPSQCVAGADDARLVAQTEDAFQVGHGRAHARVDGSRAEVLASLPAEGV